MPSHVSAIGVADPVSVMVNTFGTGKVDEKKLVEAVRASGPVALLADHPSYQARADLGAAAVAQLARDFDGA